MTSNLTTNPYNNQDLTLTNIGSPIFCFTKGDCILKNDEIWLEGALVKIETYPLLFNEYSYDFTPEDVETPAEGYFYLPDWRNRTLWGSPDGTFGYLGATAPNIAGRIGSFVEHVADGAFGFAEETQWFVAHTANKLRLAIGDFNAKRVNPAYQDGATVRPPSIKCRVKTRYR